MMEIAIASVGYTEISRNSGKSVLHLAAEACRATLDEAGLAASDVDGIISYSLNNDSVPCQAVATTLAAGELTLSLDVQYGGQSPCYLVGLAASAIRSGAAKSVLVFRALNGRTGPRVGSGLMHGPAGQHRYPIGYDSYLMYIAMWATRYLYETGQGPEDLAAVPIAQRLHAARNPRAMLRSPLDFDSYEQAPMIVTPFRTPDCTVEVDGACAVLVTSLEHARDLQRPPAVVKSTAFVTGPGAGLDIGDHVQWNDYSQNFTHRLAADLFGRAGIARSDVDFACIYDCFSSVVMMGLEGLGFCERGEAGDFVRSGATSVRGSLPVNPHGGLLAEGYLHGMNTVAEAVLQIQGGAGPTQLSKTDLAVVTSGALVDGSAMVLAADR